MRPTMEEMVQEVLGWINESSDEVREAFKKCGSDDLIFWYHQSLGRDIRNHFKLWDYEWEKVIVDDVDYSPTHPDNLSSAVIREVQKKIK